MLTDKNADRFMGFADTYNFARPSAPKIVVEILEKYLGHEPETVVDLGCGTGLSAKIWSDVAERVIGVEPGDDMRKTAIENSLDYSNIEYIKAFSDNTGLSSGIADIVTCSQSFHWMQPSSTLKEVDRLLKPGGIFAVYDYDWPPVLSVNMEMAYVKLLSRVREIEENDCKYTDSVVRYDKNEHLENIKMSGHFRYTREIVFMNSEFCNAERLYNMAISQGGLQQILRQESKLLEADLMEFRKAVSDEFGDSEKKIYFCYRMRIGV